VARCSIKRSRFAIILSVKRFFGVLLVLLAVGGGAFWWFQNAQAPRVRVTPLAQLSPQEQTQRRAQAQSVVEQARSIARDAKSGQNKPFQLVLTQDELNTLLQERLQTKNLPIENPRIGLQNGQLIFEADANYKGVQAPVSASGTVSAQNGDIAFQIDSLSLGVFPTPSGWKEKAQRAVDDGLKKALKEKGSAKIESVEIGEGTMTVQGHTG